MHLAVSSEARASMPPKLRERVEVIEYGVDLAEIDADRHHRVEVRRELGVSDDQVLVGTRPTSVPRRATSTSCPLRSRSSRPASRCDSCRSAMVRRRPP